MERKELIVLLTFQRELTSSVGDGEKSSLAKGMRISFLNVRWRKEYFSHKGEIINFYGFDRSIFTIAIKQESCEGLCEERIITLSW